MLVEAWKKEKFPLLATRCWLIKNSFFFFFDHRGILYMAAVCDTFVCRALCVHVYNKPRVAIKLAAIWWRVDTPRLAPLYNASDNENENKINIIYNTTTTREEKAEEEEEEKKKTNSVSDLSDDPIMLRRRLCLVSRDPLCHSRFVANQRVMSIYGARSSPLAFSIIANSSWRVMGMSWRRDALSRGDHGAYITNKRSAMPPSQHLDRRPNAIYRLACRIYIYLFIHIYVYIYKYREASRNERKWRWRADEDDEDYYLYRMTVYILYIFVYSLNAMIQNIIFFLNMKRLLLAWLVAGV